MNKHSATETNQPDFIDTTLPSFNVPVHPNHAIFYWARKLSKADYNKTVENDVLVDLILDLDYIFDECIWQEGKIFSKLLSTVQMQEMFILIDTFAKEMQIRPDILSKSLCLYGNYLRQWSNLEESKNWWKYVYAGALFIPNDFKFEFTPQKKRFSRIAHLFSHES